MSSNLRRWWVWVFLFLAVFRQRREGGCLFVCLCFIGWPRSRFCRRFSFRREECKVCSDLTSHRRKERRGWFRGIRLRIHRLHWLFSFGAVRGNWTRGGVVFFSFWSNSLISAFGTHQLQTHTDFSSGLIRSIWFCLPWFCCWGCSFLTSSFLIPWLSRSILQGISFWIEIFVGILFWFLIRFIWCCFVFCQVHFWYPPLFFLCFVWLTAKQWSKTAYIHIFP